MRGTAYPTAQFSFGLFGEFDPPRASPVNLARLNQAALYPIVDNIKANTQALAELLHGDFIWLHQIEGRYVVLVSNPFDHGDGELQATGTAQALLIQCFRNQRVRHLRRQVPHTLNEFGGNIAADQL